MYIKRELSSHLKRLATQYPALTITGPRQSGKTTLCKKVFSEKEYVSLERVENRKHANEDPIDFLQQLPQGAIIDEIQRAPDLPSYIQEIVDEKDEEGLFILIGSHQFELLNSVNQSLAGRTALIKLLPFSYCEINKYFKESRLEEILYKGFYPRIFDKNLDPTEASSFYINTYVERDLRDLINIKNLSKFENFLKFCAARTGQLLNVSNLANDTGVNHSTAQNWLSILEASYIITFLRPHHKNFNKRLIKSPKIYFWDTGLASFLLGITSPDHLSSHPLKGNLFETFVVTELLKQQFNQVKTPNFYFWRDNIGNETDIIIEYSDNQRPLEIKLGKTIVDGFFNGIKYYKKLNPNCYQPIVVYGGNKNTLMKNVRIITYKQLNNIKLYLSKP